VFLALDPWKVYVGKTELKYLDKGYFMKKYMCNWY
jgi:hypothetical protein